MNTNEFEERILKLLGDPLNGL